jgi:pSer/pThr/pTyr-binding forkhead associated (FHA) protein
LNDVTVSRSHAILETVDGAVRIHDNGSLNGTYVNGACVGETFLAPGDTVQIGTFHMVFLGGGART